MWAKEGLLVKYHYDIHRGVKKIKTRITIALTAAGLIIVGGGLSLGIFGSANAFGAGHTLYVSTNSIGNDKSCSNPGYNTVQSAVNAANSSDTVYLCGVFKEQVFVGKSITLTGDPGAGLTAVGTTFSSDASDYPTVFTTSNLNLPQALLVTTGNNINVTGLNISGPLPGNGGCAEDEYGVLALSGSINLKNDDVANIKDTNPGLNGCQFGVGIQIGRTYWHTTTWAYATPNPDFSASANIDGTTVSGYAKNGITVDGTGSSADIDGSIVAGGGNGQVAAQNGIQISRGATGSVSNNTIADNAYNGSGEATAAGILVYGGGGDPLATNVSVTNNKLVDNDEAINFANYNSDASGPATSQTKNVASNNWIYNSNVTNTSGLVATNGNFGYQAGIEDVGDKDSACNNTIVGPGYTDQGSYDGTTNTVTPGPDNAVVRDIDAGYTFPTTDFGTCNYGYNYGGGHFGSNFFKNYQKKFNNHWFSH